MKNLVLKCAVLFTALLISLQVSAQNVNVTGVVVDENGPVPGANVLIEGTLTGTTTDAQGLYSISAPSTATLVFSSLGYVEQKIVVGAQTKIDVILIEEALEVEELVVVGYGVQRKSDVATSVVSVDTEELSMAPAMNTSEMLRGRAAGVQISSSTGEPGSTASITIRGTRSISSSNDPMYVIDGVVATSDEFNHMSSESIASIEVLKDAASQAIYGARASGGVILVTTKRGMDAKAEVTYRGFVSVGEIWKNFDLYTAEEFVQLRREAYAGANGGLASDYSLSYVLDDQISEKVYASGDFVDWEDLMLEKAITNSHDISIRGGSENVKYSASLGYYYQDGVLTIPSDFRRATGRATVDFKISEKVGAGVNFSYTATEKTHAQGSYDDYIITTPLGMLYNDDGSLTQYINSSMETNPLYGAQHYSKETIRERTRISAFMDYKPFKNFNYRFNGSLYINHEEVGTYEGLETTGGGGNASLTNSHDKNWLVENIFSYTVPFNNKNHSLALTGVQSIDHNQSTDLGVTVSNLPIDMDYNFLSQGTYAGDPDRSWGENNLVSFMVRAQYSFMDRYLLNLAMRRDGSSKFGTSNKWANFPSVALAWRITEEDFMQDTKGWLDNLKLRVSYGSVGNQNGIGNYTTLGTTNNYSYEFGDSYEAGYLPGTTLSNPNLKWETSTTANFGLDFSVFNGRLSGTVEYYYTWTTDLIVSRSISTMLGYASMYDNLGETRTYGTDISLTADLIRKKDLSLSVTTNFSASNNHIVRIDDTVDEYGNPVDQAGNNWFIGESINVLYQVKTDGIYQYSDFDYNETTGTYTLKPTIDTNGDGIADTALDYGSTSVQPGSIKAIDSNGDGVIDTDDRVVIEEDPDFTVSLSANLKWKNFDFYMDWYCLYGGYSNNGYLTGINTGGDLTSKLNGVRVNYWTPSNASNDFPQPDYGTVDPYRSENGLSSTSYLRLRTVQVGYTLPTKFVNKLTLSNVRVYATLSNLFTATEWISYNPEQSAGSYPEPRQYLFGVNVTF